MREWRARNRERLSEQQRRRYAEDAEYRQRMRDTVNRYQRRNANNWEYRERRAESSRRYRARKKAERDG
jgi:hypothetical protein